MSNISTDYVSDVGMAEHIDAHVLLKDRIEDLRHAGARQLLLRVVREHIDAWVLLDPLVQERL